MSVCIFSCNAVFGLAFIFNYHVALVSAEKGTDGSVPVDSLCLLQREQLPQVILSDSPRSDAFGSTSSDGSFDVCEKLDSDTGWCEHSACSGGGQSPALGKVQRGDRTAVPLISGMAAGSQCAVSHKYKFVFVHVLKNAGTSTKAWLIEALCQGGEKGCDPQTLSLADCHSSMSQHPDYFRWTFARHPFDRALSVYGMAKNFNLPQNITFEEFWLDSDRWKKTSLPPDHAFSQTVFMTSPSNCLALDFIGWLPNAEKELGRVVDMMAVEPLRAHFKRKGFSRPSTGNVFGYQESLRRHATGVELVNKHQRLKQFLREEFGDDLKLLVRGFQ